MWSVVEKTALAEAEIEYHDHTSTTVWVQFPVVTSPNRHSAGAAVVIWTTTPWTLPGNRAIAYGAGYRIRRWSTDRQGRRWQSVRGRRDALVVAKRLLEQLEKALGSRRRTDRRRLKGANSPARSPRHPLRGQGYDFDVPLLPGEFVTDEAGTGFVHIAPGHGEDDFELGRKHDIKVPDTVAEDGRYLPHVPLFAGKRVYRPDGKEGDANGAVIEALDAAGGLSRKAS